MFDFVFALLSEYKINKEPNFRLTVSVILIRFKFCIFEANS